MYSIEEFKEIFISWLEENLQSQYGPLHVVTEPVTKINCELTGIQFVMQGSTRRISPVIYLEDVYKQYCMEEDEIPVFVRMKNVIVEAIEKGMEFNQEMLEKIRNDRSNIYFHFIHTRQNEALLETMPHREFHDLSIVYRSFISQDDDGVMSAQINNKLAEVMGLEEEELYQLAYINTRRLFPQIVKPVNQVMEELMEDCDEETTQKIKKLGGNEENLMYVVANEMKEKAAINILYTDELQKVAEHEGCNLFLVPSSIHEMLAIPEKHAELGMLEEMVHEVNQTISLQERLSNEIYKYDRETQCIEQVTDSPYKMLVEETSHGMEMGM